ncbi:hypothetical protein Tco_0540532 [Tanacetum coccineum]
MSRHIKRGQDTKIPQSSGPPEKVGDEAVHKELGDRMERAATTASSLEVEQDSGSGPRCQDTILGDVNAQTSPKFAETHNVVAFLEKPEESDGFAEIIDFLKASSVSYALTVNPVIYTSCIEQFWATAKVQTVNGVRQLQALVDKKRVIVTESSIRRDLHLDDAEGTDCLPTATIFEELARMGYEKPSQKLTFYKAFFSPQWKYFIHTITQCLSAKSTAWNEFSSSMASLIICLATNQKFNLSKYIFDAMVKHLDGGVKFLLYPRFLQVFINQQLGNMSTHKKIFVNPFHTKKVFANMKRAGNDFSRRITPLFDTMMVQPVQGMGEDLDHLIDSTPIHIIDQPSSSSQPKKDKPSQKAQRQEAKVPQDEVEHEESVPTPSNDPQPSGEDSMQLTNLMKRIQRLERKKKSRPTGLKRLRKVGMSRRVKSSTNQESLGAPEDASKQGRSIEDIDTDVDDDVMHVEAKVDGKDKYSKKPDDSTAGEAVTTASIDDTMGFEVQKNKEKKEEVESETVKGKQHKKDALERKKSSEQNSRKTPQRNKTIDAIPLATKLPVIIDYKLHKEGMLVHYELIRADGSSKRYSSMIRMLQGIDREDLEALWRICNIPSF